MSRAVLRPLSFIILSTLVLYHATLGADISNPLSPAEAQKAFQLADSSLTIELAAAEPDVIDPVAIRFDEDGRMWVVQMTDYPLGNPTGGEPLSKIRVLEDRDGDGRFETATTFADKLLFATGIQPWKGGAFVTMSGKLVYMKDTDGDGRADVNETWFEGFAEQNSQLRANHPRLALDNWIYVANGLRGGKVINRKLGETEPINISGMDFRFNPLTGAAEAVSGNGQFGLSFDDWGNRFVCSNRNPVKHVVIEDRYLKANPGVTVPATVNDVAPSGEQSHIFPVSRAWTTSNLHAGQFTAACGVYIYRGDLLPAEFKGNAFTCDPTGNLIHREIMEPAGPTFKSHAAYEGKEFLASPDEWFRPVNMELGPDGALYVVDMYRCVIEHPDFVPEELKRRPDLRLGDDRGRIWRIKPANTNPTRQQGTANTSPPHRPGQDAPPLSKLASEELIALFAHENAWQRETAQRLLIERETQPSEEQLAKLIKGMNSPQGKVHLLSLIRQVHSKEATENLLVPLLRDSHTRVRAAAVFAISSMDNPTSGLWHRAVRELFVDEAPEVRFAARLVCRPTLTAPESRGKKIAVPPSVSSQTMIVRALKDADDPWQRAAVRLGFDMNWIRRLVSGITGPLMIVGEKRAIARKSHGAQLLVRDFVEQVVVNAESDESANSIALSEARELQGDRELSMAVLVGGMRGLSRRKLVPRDVVGFQNPSSNIHLSELRDRLCAVIQRREAEKHDQHAALRKDALEVLSYLPNSSTAILDFTSEGYEQPIRTAAIAALARHSQPSDWQKLIDTFASDTPAVRRAILDGLLSNADRTKLLLDAIEAGKVKTSEIDLTQAKRLTTYRDVSIRDRAQKLFAAAMPADRTKALADYQPALAMKGDAKHGQVIFEKNCAVCHRIAGIGVNVAPDISDSRTKKPEQILADILQPNRAIDNNYLGYTVRQTDGTVLTGILAAETATSITLRQQGGKEAVLPRGDIDELRSTGQSLMPEGLERQIPPQDMADLVAFIKNWRYLDGRTPLSDNASR
jgi:putative membrane-bound dehydrogenase-like protein